MLKDHAKNITSRDLLTYRVKEIKKRAFEPKSKVINYKSKWKMPTNEEVFDKKKTFL